MGSLRFRPPTLECSEFAGRRPALGAGLTDSLLACRIVAQAEAATVRLREAQRKLEAARAQQSASVDGSQPLRSPSGRAPVQITAAVTRPVPIKSPKPQHSAEAMRARIEGTVTLEVLVDERGLVADARVLKSIPLLDQSALEAARQWEFKPAMLNGEPVPVLIQLELNFTLK